MATENPPRPVPLLVNFDEIPGELRYLNQWVLWRYTWKEDKGKWDKPPLQPDGRLASSTAKLTWSTFQVVREAYECGLNLPVDDPQHFDGVGFVPAKVEKAENQIVLGDLDKCCDKDTGEIDADVLKELEFINSYCELSPSGTGIRFIAKGNVLFPEGQDGAKNGLFELYQARHYLTITGHRLTEYPTSIEKRSDELNAFYNKHFTKGENKSTDKTPSSVQSVIQKLTDDQIIALASEAHNGDKFLSLMAGNWQEHLNRDGKPFASESEADEALCCILVFYTRDEDQILRIVGRSKLFDEKWKRSDYQHKTIGKALELVKEGYKGGEMAAAEEISEEELKAYTLPEGPKFECELPKDNFIQRFIAYGSEVSDAYPDFWLAGALHALAVIADKKLKMVLKQGTIYPNLYISINGKSSLSRKSTVVDKTEALLCQVLPQLISSRVPTEFSPEAFTEHLSDYNHAPWVRDEAAGVLSLMKRDYMRGFKDSLMQIYDCKPFCRKLRTSQRKNVKTEFKVDDPYLNVLFATTDASLGVNTEQNDTLSGFMARFLFFFPQGKNPTWLPLEEGTAQNSIFENVVRSQLISIATKIGGLQECTAMHFSPEAAKFYTEWQRIREDEWTTSNDGFCMQIYSRLAPTVAKLGMLFELGSPDFDVSKPIRLEFIQEACRLVDSYFMPTARAVYDLVGSNAEKNVIDRITAYLKNHSGKATKKEILRDVKIKSADFDDYLLTMIESDVVETKVVKRGGKGRNSLWVLLLNQGNVGKVGNVAIISNIANVDNDRIKGDNIGREKSTLATLATNAIFPIVTPKGEEPRPSESNDLAVLVRLATNYDTQLAEPDNPFRFSPVHLQEGDEILVDYEKARSWKSRGVVSVVEVFLPWDPSRYDPVHDPVQPEAPA